LRLGRGLAPPEHSSFDHNGRSGRFVDRANQRSRNAHLDDSPNGPQTNQFHWERLDGINNEVAANVGDGEHQSQTDATDYAAQGKSLRVNAGEHQSDDCLAEDQPEKVSLEFCIRPPVGHAFDVNAFEHDSVKEPFKKENENECGDKGDQETRDVHGMMMLKRDPNDPPFRLARKIRQPKNWPACFTLNSMHEQWNQSVAGQGECVLIGGKLRSCLVNHTPGIAGRRIRYYNPEGLRPVAGG
jgi:hypothetical protein